MGSIGKSNTTSYPSDNLPQEIYDIIGQKVHKLDDVSDINQVNPNYFNSEITIEDFDKYHRNCQRCAPAVELQYRGYDVEALAFDGNFPKMKDVFDIPLFEFDGRVTSGSRDWYPSVEIWNEHLKNPNKFGRGSKAAADLIDSKMKDWGEGSRAVLSVTWKDTGRSHIVNVVREGGHTKIYDGQSDSLDAVGKEQIQKYMSKTVAIKSNLLRTDNLKIKTDAKKLKEIVKRRTK